MAKHSTRACSRLNACVRAYTHRCEARVHCLQQGQPIASDLVPGHRQPCCKPEDSARGRAVHRRIVAGHLEENPLFGDELRCQRYSEANLHTRQTGLQEMS